MISAPLRPAQKKSTETKTAETTPSVKTQGHLALLEWDKTLPTAAAAPSAFGPRPKSLTDRCYEGGTLVLLAVTVAALAAAL